MRVTIDALKCIGSGSCVIECPEVFDQDDEGIVVLLNDDPGPELAAAVRLAAAVCPTACIEVDE